MRECQCAVSLAHMDLSSYRRLCLVFQTVSTKQKQQPKRDFNLLISCLHAWPNSLPMVAPCCCCHIRAGQPIQPRRKRRQATWPPFRRVVQFLTAVALPPHPAAGYNEGPKRRNLSPRTPARLTQVNERFTVPPNARRDSMRSDGGVRQRVEWAMTQRVAAKDPPPTYGAGARSPRYSGYATGSTESRRLCAGPVTR